MPIERTKGVILGPNGAPASLPTEVFTAEEAKLLREYKKFLLKHHFQEALVCQDCSSYSTRFAVTDDRIVGNCDCRLFWYQGVTI